MHKPRSLLSTVGSISSATLLSRVLGLVRDQVQSYYFGAGPVTDAFLAAFRIPNLLRDLFAEGAMSSAFVPTFTAERQRHGTEAAWRLARRLMTMLGLILGVLALLIALGAPWIVGLYVAGFEPEYLPLTVSMTRILAPFLLFVALAAVAMGVLNTCGRFFLPALAPASFNVAAILGVVLLAPLLPRLGFHPALSLALGASVGGILQFAVQIPALRREGFRFQFELALSDPALRRIAILMVPATLGLAATQINILVDTVIASWYPGAITWLQLSFRLMQLPIGLFGVAIGMVNLSRVSLDASRGDMPTLRANLAASLRTAALLTLPATAGLVALRRPIVVLLFEHGQFDASDSAKTAAALLFYALGLYAYSVTKIQVPTFYALGETRVPVLASVTAVALKIGANFLFIFLLQQAGLDAFLGLALSTSLAAWINFGILAVALRRRLGPLRGEGLGSTAVKMAALSSVMGAACSLAHRALERGFGGGALAGELARLGGAMAVGVLVLSIGLSYLDLPELRLLRRRLMGGTGVRRPPD